MNLFGLLSRISPRERTMLLALVGVGLLIWLGFLWRQWDESGVQLRNARRELDQQDVWLRNADQFDRDLTETLSRLNPESTLDASALAALVDTMVREGDLKHELGAPSTAEGEVFVQHSLRVNLKNAALPDLIALERRLRTHYPYAALGDLSITANKADPRLLNARLTVTSYQLRSSLPSRAKGEKAGADERPSARPLKEPL